MLRNIENWHNRLSDLPVIWFPFQALKPQADQMISFPRSILMSFCFGFYANLFFILRGVIFAGEAISISFIYSKVAFVAGFFVWFNVVTRPFWNRRAARLQKKAS